MILFYPICFSSKLDMHVPSFVCSTIHSSFVCSTIHSSFVCSTIHEGMRVYYFAAGQHSLLFQSWEEVELEQEPLVISILILQFVWPSEAAWHLCFVYAIWMLGTLLSLIDMLPLLSNTAWSQNSRFVRSSIWGLHSRKVPNL
jgi:hypothetical protein